MGQEGSQEVHTGGDGHITGLIVDPLDSIPSANVYKTLLFSMGRITFFPGRVFAEVCRPQGRARVPGPAPWARAPWAPWAQCDPRGPEIVGFHGFQGLWGLSSMGSTDFLDFKGLN